MRLVRATGARANVVRVKTLMRGGRATLTGVAVALACRQLGAQASRPTVVFDQRGITVQSRDSATQLTFRFRLQTLATTTTESGSDLSVAHVAWAPRRLRLRATGTVLDPRLSINLQLSFTRQDMDYADTQFPNIVRDAAISWRFSDHFVGTFGQTKLPGNRQRVISSGELQFAERSILNSQFTPDRDFGFMGAWRDTVAGVPIHISGALTEGDGRNTGSGNGGLAWTGRIEVLPLGPFDHRGDYSEGAPTPQHAPRLSVGVTVSHNERAVRTGGQLGLPLWAPRTMTTPYADVLFKWGPAAIYIEAASRTAADPVTTAAGSAPRIVYAGRGAMAQASWAFGEWEPAVRYALVSPDAAILGNPGSDEQRQATLNLTRYLQGHRVKWQAELTLHSVTDVAAATRRSQWISRLSFEIGI